MADAEGVIGELNEKDSSPSRFKVREFGTTTKAMTRQPPGSSINLDEIESAVRELLRRYRSALQYGADMPLLGRSAAKTGRPRTRWGSRLYTRAYVETHVRKQLQAIRDCLRLELMGAPEADAERILVLDGELARHVEPLFRWRRLVGLLARLPTVAAAVPIVSAASVWPLREDVSADDALYALLVLAGTTLAVWLLVVWPSLRLGFRIKRVIFAGGSDLRHPLVNPDSEVEWEGFHQRSGGGSREFPENVYEAEDEVYCALGRRKPVEIPVDMLLGLGPYLWIAYSAFFFWGLVDVIAEHRLWETVSDTPSGFFIAAMLALVPLFFPRYAARSYRLRPH
jgi:hypothetical protein